MRSKQNSPGALCPFEVHVVVVDVECAQESCVGELIEIEGRPSEVEKDLAFLLSSLFLCSPAPPLKLHPVIFHSHLYAIPI